MSESRWEELFGRNLTVKLEERQMSSDLLSGLFVDLRLNASFDELGLNSKFVVRFKGYRMVYNDMKFE